MKKLLVLLAVLFVGHGFAQNWQTVRSDKTYYLKADDTDSDYDPMLAVSCDSAQFVAGDSILYPYKSIRYNEWNQSSPCSFIEFSGWLGSHVIIEADGTNIFWRKDTSAISIETLAPLGTVFKMYTFPSGDSIMAEVTSVTEELVLGSMDSVKTFTLSSNSTINVSPAEFKISKNHGFTSVLPPYSFPDPYDSDDGIGGLTIADNYELVGQENPDIGITRPSNFNINNLEIGDVIKYRYLSGPMTKYYDVIITNKYSTGVDQVAYERNVTEITYYAGTSQQDPAYTSSITYADTEYYDISNVLWVDYIPGKLYMQSGKDMTLYLSHSVDCGFKANIDSHGAIADSSGCMDNWHQAKTNHIGYSGGLSYYDSHIDIQVGGMIYNNIFLYKSNSGTECGTPFYVALPEIEELEFQIFPNPANEMIYIESSSEWLTYSIMTLDGKILDEGVQQSSIDVAALPAGIFILQLTTENGVTAKKFVKD